MNMIDLLLLGRLLQRLGSLELQQASPVDATATPAEILLLSEVFRSESATIGTLATRTGFVQSHVSTLAARLAERGQLHLESDPADRRRTLVSLPPGVMHTIKATLMDDATPLLAELVGDSSPIPASEVEASLALLLNRLRERFPGMDANIVTLEANPR